MPPLHFFIAFREEGEGEGELRGERERHQCEKKTIGCLLICAPNGDQTHSLGMCPGQEWNSQPSGLRDNTPTSWATLARALLYFLKLFDSLVIIWLKTQTHRTAVQKYFLPLYLHSILFLYLKFPPAFTFLLKIKRQALAGVAQWIERGLRSKGSRVDWQSGHMPRFRARSPVRGVQEVTTHWCFSPSFSFPSPLSKCKINKILKNKTKQLRDKHTH